MLHLVLWMVVTVVLGSAPAGIPAAEVEGLRVMTFNIRYDNPKDGPHGWANRKDKVAGMVKLYAADIVGMQEALRSQIDDLAERLPQYEWIGVGRQDGKDAGEFTPIFYKRDHLELLDKSTFWLSETPDKAGSRSWDAALPRIVTWAKFKEKPNGAQFYLFNTHFDHLGPTARLESAKLLRSKVAATAANQPAVVIGDFNCQSNSPPYQWLIGNETPPPAGDPNTSAAASNGGKAESKESLKESLADAMNRTRSPHHGPTTTWNGFKALVPGRKIDHIFVRGPIAVEQHAILADHWDGRFPSDHLPVLVEIVLEKGK
jgi:endonuclease/exonuclease/phosphatase family metal-dependent hydrolase